MSTAHVTGVVALLLHKHPGLTPAQVEADLTAEATPLGSSYYYGAGEVNAYRAAQ
jgi:subtilisin